MIFSLKSKLISLLVTIVLLISAFAFLTHHPIGMGGDGHSECDTTCQIACFNQAVSNVVAIPTNLVGFAYAIALVAIAFIPLLIIKLYTNQGNVFRYKLGPPLYKQFESYRI